MMNELMEACQVKASWFRAHAGGEGRGSGWPPLLNHSFPGAGEWMDLLITKATGRSSDPLITPAAPVINQNREKPFQWAGTDPFDGSSEGEM